MAELRAFVDFCGRKGLALLVVLTALVVVGVADKQAAEAIGWCIVGAYGIFCGANSAVTIGTKVKVPPPKEGESE